jgi:TIR domain
MICFLSEVVQNDEVKEEIVNEDGMYLLGECAYRPDLDARTIREPALRIIEAISFASKASEKIRDHDLLMDHVVDLAKSNDQIQAAIAKRVLWNAEKRDEFVASHEEKQKHPTETEVIQVFDEKYAIYQYVNGDHRFNSNSTKSTEKYDILISYHPGDREMCHKIYERFVATDLHRVSIDTNGLHSSNPELMATTVDNSSIVIICFSRKYRRSYACRLEAEFAKRRHARLIGIKIDRDYDVSGWLKKTLEEIEPIDFTKPDLKSAYAQLDQQIRLNGEV